MADALDLSKEKPETLRRYLGSGKDEFPFSYNRRPAPVPARRARAHPGPDLVEFVY
jgi:hypothetical protein